MSQEITSVLHRLLEAGLVPAVSDTLRPKSNVVLADLRSAVLTEVEAFTTSRNPDILPSLAHHLEEHVTEILRLLGGGASGSLGFVRGHAHIRAEQHFPLEAVLHAYRCGHRVLSQWLREAAIAVSAPDPEAAVAAVADFAIAYTNAISSVIAAEYVSRSRSLAEAEGDRRNELLNVLLAGHDESDGRVNQILRRAGYLDHRQSYCVLAVQATQISEMDNTARAMRIVEAINDVLASRPVRVLAGIRNNLVIAVLSSVRRFSGWTAPQSALGDLAYEELLKLGPSVLIGLSADQPSTAFVPKALEQALIAHELATVSDRVVAFSKLSARQILLNHGRLHLSQLAPVWLERLVEADTKSEGNLGLTLRAIAEADMNLQAAARLLGKHANTVYQRVERLKGLTGLDAQKYHDLSELLLCLDLARR